jgi:Outer membrane protein beta-barrel domain
MNKLLLTLSLTLLTTFSFAQTFDLGIKAGVNLSTVSFNNPIPNYVVGFQNTTGFQAGVIEDINFQHFTIQPGLFFITKGDKFTDELSITNPGNSYQSYNYHNTGSEKFNYLELPINVLYKVKASPMAKIYAGGGPYIGYGLSGTTSSQLTGSQTSDYHGSIDFGTDHTKNDYKLFDYGANLIAGVELKKHYTIDLNYSLGLRNIVWSSIENVKNRSLGLSVGYLF